MDPNNPDFIQGAYPAAAPAYAAPAYAAPAYAAPAYAQPAAASPNAQPSHYPQAYPQMPPSGVPQYPSAYSPQPAAQPMDVAQQNYAVPVAYPAAAPQAQQAQYAQPVAYPSAMTPQAVPVAAPVAPTAIVAGVQAGQPPAAGNGDFISGICECHSCGVCCCSWCCGCVRWPMTMSRANLLSFPLAMFLYFLPAIIFWYFYIAYINWYFTSWNCYLYNYYAFYDWCYAYPPDTTLMYLGFISAVLLGFWGRRKLRTKFGLYNENPCVDCLLWWCCRPCVINQEAYHVDKAMGRL